MWRLTLFLGLFLAPLVARAQAGDAGVAPASASVAARLAQVSIDRLRVHLERLTGLADVTTATGPKRIRSRSVRHPDHKLAEDYLVAELAALGLEPKRLPFDLPRVGTFHNIEATIVGSAAPGEIYVVSAHYDSTASQERGYAALTDPAPGADDDATGTALVLEAARVLRDAKPRATLRFVLFSAEEESIVGSDAYARAAKARGDDIRFVLSMDPIGNTGPLAGNLYFTYNIASEALAHTAEATRERYAIATPVLVVPGDSPLFPDDRSDHRSFWAEGYLGLHGGSLPGDAYHTFADTLEKVDLPFVADATRVAIALVADAAGPIAAPPPTVRPGGSGCSAVGADAGAVAWLFLILALMYARRLSNETRRQLWPST